MIFCVKNLGEVSIEVNQSEFRRIVRSFIQKHMMEYQNFVKNRKEND